MKLSDLSTKVLGDKKRWWAYRARKKDLPESYRVAIDGVERYLNLLGGITKGDIIMTMLEDLLDLFEQSAASGTTIRGIVGDDPVEFVENFLSNYEEGRWINKERVNLVKAIERAEGIEHAEDAKETGRQGRRWVVMSTQVLDAIVVRDLEKSFGDLDVLRGVEFTVERGTIFALLGSNGAGKTTVVRILSTLLRADAGTVAVNGFDVATRASDVRESISLTGQFAAVDEILTGRENLVLVARLRHTADPGVIADELLSRFALTEAGGRRVSTYSGGMKRRLDIAMSLIGSPPVIVLDEPTTGLDPQARLEVWQTVKDLADGGTTVLLTTQYLDEAEHLADRIAILHEGRIIENGTLAELKALIPPATVEYVEKQPTLEDVFLAIVGGDTGPKES